jgi:hypothetical protein
MKTLFNLAQTLHRRIAVGVVILAGFVTSHCAQDNLLAELDGKIAIDSISPVAGPVGSEVKIYGKGFSAVGTNNELSINGVKADVLEPASLTVLVIKVPDNATTGNVSLNVGNVTAQGPVFTVVDPPVVQTVSPLQGFAGYRVFVRGSKLSQVTRIDFNGIPGQIFDKSETEIVVEAPGSTTGNIELIFPGGKVTGPVFTYLPIPLIDTAGVVQYNRQEDAIAIIGKHFSVNASDLKVKLNGQNHTILYAGVADEGRQGVIINMPSPEVDNPTILEIESEGIKSLPFEFVIPPSLNDLSYNYVGNSITRIRLELYGSYFGIADPLKKVNIVQVGDVITPVPSTIISWTPTLITVEVDILHGLSYDASIEVKGKLSRELNFRP